MGLTPDLRQQDSSSAQTRPSCSRDSLQDANHCIPPDPLAPSGKTGATRGRKQCVLWTLRPQYSRKHKPHAVPCALGAMGVTEVGGMQMGVEVMACTR
jgi:hypothetical protein